MHKHDYKALLMVAVIVILILLSILLSGCQTLKGATGDSAWMLQKLSDNIVNNDSK